MKWLSALALAGISASVNAQTATYAWQVSLDGNTWSDIVRPSPGTLVHVRLLAGWMGVTGTDLGYAGGQFDATLLGATSASTVSNIVRPTPFAFAAQTLVASTYGNGAGIKIDVASDLAAPGAGTGWVNPGQAAKDFAAPGTYNSNNPCVVFTFDVVANDEIHVSMVLNQTTGRSLSVYSNSSGTQVRMNASATNIEAAYIGFPTPGSLSFICIGGIFAVRRLR